uniref:Uncharacterized protein n=1 Tax=Rhizophora mucronata TaxID=61149 RepID=A0A2P2QG69_RHIMU
MCTPCLMSVHMNKHLVLKIFPSTEIS